MIEYRNLLTSDDVDETISDEMLNDALDWDE